MIQLNIQVHNRRPEIEVVTYRHDCAMGANPKPNLRPCSLETTIENSLYITAEGAVVEIIEDQPLCRQHRYNMADEIPERVAQLKAKARDAEARANMTQNPVDHQWHKDSANWLRQRARTVTSYPDHGKTADFPEG